MREILDEILGDFPACAEQDRRLSDLITFCFPPGYKARFDKLQRATDRAFVRKVREVIMEMIELAEERLA